MSLEADTQSNAPIASFPNHHSVSRRMSLEADTQSNAPIASFLNHHSVSRRMSLEADTQSNAPIASFLNHLVSRRMSLEVKYFCHLSRVLGPMQKSAQINRMVNTEDVHLVCVSQPFVSLLWNRAPQIYQHNDINDDLCHDIGWKDFHLFFYFLRMLCCHLAWALK